MDKHKLARVIEGAIIGKAVRVADILAALTLDDRVRPRTEFSKDSMLKAFVLAKLKGIKFNSKLSLYMGANENDALAMGFFKDTNSRIRVPDRRTFGIFEKNLSEEDNKLIEFVAKTIDDIAHVIGVTLDYGIFLSENSTKTTAEENGKKHVKERTEEAAKEVKKILLHQLKKGTKYNAIYNDESFLDLLIHIAISKDFAKNGSKVLTYLQNGERVPTGVALFYYLDKYSIEEVSEVFNKIFDITSNLAEKAKIISRRGRYTIAIDCHKWEYWGKRIDKFVVGKEPEHGTNRCFKFITLDVTNHEQRFTLCALPFLDGDKQNDLVIKLLNAARAKINIHTVLIDRGFLDSELLNYLKKEGLYFIIPSKKSNRALLKDASFLKPAPVGVLKDVLMGNVRVNLIVKKEGDKLYGFFTNMNIVTGDNNLALAIANMYERRWQIESGYRVKKDFRGKTTSKKYIIRFLYFMLSVILYNFWVLVNSLVILDLNLKSTKPVISAKVLDAILYSTKVLLAVT